VGVANFKGSEHFDYIKLYVLRDIEEVLERYNNLISDNMVGNNIEILDYKF
jgi:hypothetical protein